MFECLVFKIYNFFKPFLLTEFIIVCFFVFFINLGKSSTLSTKAPVPPMLAKLRKTSPSHKASSENLFERIPSVRKESDDDEDEESESEEEQESIT